MPRHDRAHGHWHQTSPKGGNASRRTRSPSPYDPAYRRADWNVPPIPEWGRKNGTSQTPQSPKGGKGRPAPTPPNPKKDRPAVVHRPKR